MLVSRRRGSWQASLFLKKKNGKGQRFLPIAKPQGSVARLERLMRAPFQPVMGFFLYTHSVAFAEDLGIHAEEIHSKDEFHGEADHRFTQAAYNCWIAACLYVGECRPAYGALSLPETACGEVRKVRLRIDEYV
ncbi:hypothetical protein HPB48_016775 [Haemaphysalis longicornis]|uniref:Uncharacterized protein n=1 Tax=Haemaphysalis longicornis TaxID=44386 RepID=A0A9J6FSI5_HAELO|nr:hypothetical protein HPB48_016775 [Haemaphysalis longicornis]